MPSRLIREGWLESEPVNKLDASAERFFLRLCLRADDYGRFHANPVLLKSSLFPLSDDIRGTDIPRWLAACEKAGLVRCYEVESKRFVEIPKFDQRMRAKRSKFPGPPPVNGRMPVTCLTDDSHPRTESESESEADTNAETESIHPSTPAAPSCDGPTVISAEVIYDAYPRKVAKQDAIKAITKAMNAVPAIKLLERTMAFADATKQWGEHEMQFIPHPATWFNRGSYDDDPTTWTRRTKHDDRGKAGWA